LLLLLRGLSLLSSFCSLTLIKNERTRPPGRVLPLNYPGGLVPDVDLEGTRGAHVLPELQGHGAHALRVVDLDVAFRAVGVIPVEDDLQRILVGDLASRGTSPEVHQSR